MYLGLNIGSLLFEGEPLDTNSGDPANIALPKLQRETDSASTPASKLLSDYTIAEVKNNSNRIDESVLKADFCNTLDKICQEVHHQNCEELSKQSLENALEFQGGVDEDFIKEKVSDIDVSSLSLLFEGELLDTNSGDPVNIALPNLQRETDSTSTPASNLLSDYTIAEVENNSNRIDESVLKADFCNTFDKICQEVHHQYFEDLENGLEFQGGVDEDFIKEKVSDIDVGSLSLLFEGELLDTNSGDPVNIALPNLQRETDSTSTPASNLLSDYTIAEVENNSNRIDESVLKADFCNTFDKICQEAHHHYFEDLENALEFQGGVDEDFIKEKVSDIDVGSLSLLFEGELLDTNSGDPVNIALPKLQREIDSASTPASKLLSDYTIAQVENNSNRIDESVLKADFCNTFDKICQEAHHQYFEDLENALEFQGGVDEDFIKEKVSDIDVGSLSLLFEGELLDTNSGNPVNIALPNLQRETDSTSTPASNLLSDYTIAEVENNSNRIDESVLKADFCNTLEKACQEKHHQNFEELSKQSLKNALEFQGEVYQDFTEEKAKLSKQQDKCEYSCIVTDCSFTDKHRSTIRRHLFKHIKVSPYYCEQCLPDTFFTRDVANLNKHKKIHLLNITIPKPVQNKIVENNSKRIDESVLKEDFYNTLDKKCQEKHYQNFKELSKQSLKNALEFQSKVYQHFTKEKVSLFEKQLVPPDRYEYPCVVTDCSFTHKRRTTVKRHLFKHINVSPYYCEQCLPHTFFVRDMAALNRHKSNAHVLDKVISKRDIKRIHQPVQNTMNFFSECNVSQVSDQQQTDSASTPASKLLSDDTIVEVENSSTRIDESVLKEDFYNTLDKKCQEKYHQNFEELSKQSLKNALKFQGRADEDFIKEKVSDIDSLSPSPLFEGELLDTNSGDPVNIALPKLQQQTDSDSTSTLASKLLSDDTIVEVENSSNRIDENALKTAFYNTLDKICQEKHHQNFEEFSKQSLKKALEIQGEVYEDFIKEKVKFSKKQLVSTDRYGYPCIVTNCAFTHRRRATVQAHLFKHTKVSPHYCEQCLPDTFFARDIANLNKHKRSVHFLDKVISKRGIKPMHQPVQNTMNGSSGFTVNQESGSCLLLNSAKRAKTDP